MIQRRRWTSFVRPAFRTVLLLGLACTSDDIGTATVGPPVGKRSDPGSGSRGRPVASVSIEPSSATIAVGGTVQLAATIRDKKGNVLDGRPVTWLSLDGAIATVDQAGLVRAVGAGAASITATSEGVSDTAHVVVSPPSPSWRTLASLPTQVGAGVAATDGLRVYVFGGGPAGVLTDLTYIYNPTTNSWSTGARFTGARAFAMAGTLTDGIHLVGGVSHETDHQVYDPATDSWQSRAPLPIGVRAGVAEVVGGKLYVIGGVGSSAGVTNVVQIYDPGADSWTPGAAMPTARLSAVSTVIDGRIYVAGGEEPGITTSERLEAYDPNTNAWASLAPLPAVRESMGGGELQGLFCVFGGRLSNPLPTGDAFPETFCYAPAANTWSNGPNMLTPRVTIASVELGGSVYALGGRSGPTNSTVAERLDP